MIIEINAISATEARELGKTYRFYQSKANEQLAIAAAKVIEAIITPSIKQDAKTSNFSYFEAHKTRTCYNNLQEFLNIVDGANYHFNYGFYCDYKDDESKEEKYSQAQEYSNLAIVHAINACNMAGIKWEIGTKTFKRS